MIPVDRYTVVHLAFGALAHRSRVGFGQTVGIATVFELIENPIKDAYAPLWPDVAHDTPEKGLSDILAAGAGWQLGSAAPELAPLLVALAGFIWTSSLQPTDD